jgi:enterochelin esterase family protein
MRKFALLPLLVAFSIRAQKNPLQEMIEAARANSPALKDLLAKGMPTLAARGAVAVWGQDYLFAVDAPKASVVSIALQGKPPVPMMRATGSTIWYRVEKYGAGALYRFQFYADGKPMSANDNFSYDATGYLPDSYPRPGVPRGVQSEMKTQISKIYPDMTSNYWVYVNPGVDTVRGAPLMVWQDGETHVDAADLIRKRMQIVTDNLVHQKKIPPMIHVLVSPGTSKEGRAMRSVQYDTVSGLYGRYLLEEILPEVQKKYKIRADAYSRAIEGISSGAICAWNVAWYYPEQFSRVISKRRELRPPAVAA